MIVLNVKKVIFYIMVYVMKLIYYLVRIKLMDIVIMKDQIVQNEMKQIQNFHIVYNVIQMKHQEHGLMENV